MTIKLKDVITNKTAVFVECHTETLFYEIDGTFRFAVPVAELGGAAVKNEEKASTFMKWIKNAVKQINESES